MPASQGLTGQELLDELARLDGAPDRACARACGYVTVSKDGTERVRLANYYKACAEARGQTFASKGGTGRPRPLSYRGKAGVTNGHAVIGARYMELIGVMPGESFSIKIDGTTIMLEPANSASEAALAFQAPALAAA